MKTYKIIAALAVGSILLASKCQCDDSEDPGPTEEMVNINTMD